MASVFGHGFSAFVFTKLYKKKSPKKDVQLYTLSALCAICPDFDVISFEFGIAYSSPFGHRGLTHSLIFAVLFGMLISYIYRKIKSNPQYAFWSLSAFFAICTASHGLLDAMTSGGRGVGFFIPFENARFFLPFRPIQVSPLGIENFFSSWGLSVLYSEFKWIFLPGMLLILLRRLLSSLNKVMR